MPQKIRASAAALAEANNEDVVFTFRGTEYTVTRKTIKSGNFRRAIQRGNDTEMCDIMLGPAQSTQFWRANGDEDGNETMAEFFEVFGEANGSGNS